MTTLDLFAVLDDSSGNAPEMAVHSPKESTLTHAPVGRVMVRGTVVRKTAVSSRIRGTKIDGSVMVRGDSGVWFAIGAIPMHVAQGDEVEFVATLKAGRAPHIAEYVRPSEFHVLAAA